MTAPPPADHSHPPPALSAEPAHCPTAEQDWVTLAATLCQTPIALLGRWVDGRLCWQAAVGWDDPLPPSDRPWVTAIQTRTGIVIGQAGDRAQAAPPAVGNLPIQVYAGISLQDNAGQVVGLLVVMDVELRSFTMAQQHGLEALGRQASRHYGAVRHASPPDPGDRLLESVVNSATDWMFTKNAQGEYLFVNPAFAQALGKSVADLVGRTDEDLFPPALSHRIHQEDLHILATGESITYEETMTLDHQVRTFLTLKTPRRDAAGRVVGVVGISRDISDRKQIEAELQLFKQAVESSSDAIGMADAQGRHVYQNSAFSAMYECESAEDFMAAGGIPAVFVDPTVPDQIFATIARGENFIAEVEQQMPSGRRIQVFLRASAIYDPTGKQMGVVAIHTDVTERQQTQRRLEESQQFLQLILDSIPQAVVWKDRQSVYRGGNRNSAIAAGFDTVDEIIGKTDYDMPWTPEEAKRYRESDRHVMTTGRPWLGKLDTQTRPEGIVWLNTNKIPLRDATGAVTGVLVTIEDITPLKRIEQELQEQAAREKLLNHITRQIRHSFDFEDILPPILASIRTLLRVEHCSFGLYNTDSPQPRWQLLKESRSRRLSPLTGNHLTAYLAATLNHPSEQAGIHIAQVDSEVPSPLTQFCQAFKVQAILSRSIPMTEERIGVLTCLSQDPRPWSEDEQQLLQAVMEQLAIAFTQAELYQQTQRKAQQLEQTLSELRRTQAQVIQTEKMSSLGQLAAGLSHEINNPLGFIAGNIDHLHDYVQALLDIVTAYQTHDPNPPAAIQTVIQAAELDYITQDLPDITRSMHHGIERIMAIVQALNAFARLDEVGRKRIDLHANLDHTLIIVQNLLHTHHITLIKDYSPTKLHLDCYPGDLNQALMNILLNAIDALKDRPTDRCLRIRTASAPSHVIIAIADNGNGMTPEIQAKVFDPFFTTKPVGSGTGLGLTTSYAILCDRHGGTLDCQSVPGNGTEFIITLPLQPAQ
jgi:PAS domain S-box-containing protein